MDETNQKLATIFANMADALVLEGANPHRIRAYRNASETIENLTESIEAVARQERLQELPGIGKDLAAKIKEYLSTGTIQTREPTTQPLPPDVAQWSTLPGFSPRLVQYIYYQLGIQSLADLEALVQSHMLQTLPGITVPDYRILEAIRARFHPTNAEDENKP